MTPTTAYLLDTNILVLLIRGKAVGQAVARNFGLLAGSVRSLISVVTVGEMKALVRKWGWGPQKVAALDQLLGRVIWVDINHPDVLSAYADLDHTSSLTGRNMGKNDLWIAATAKVCGVPLLTTDGDFDHLHPAEITRFRIDDKTGNALP